MLVLLTTCSHYGFVFVPSTGIVVHFVDYLQCKVVNFVLLNCKALLVWPDLPTHVGINAGFIGIVN